MNSNNNGNGSGGDDGSNTATNTATNSYPNTSANADGSSSGISTAVPASTGSKELTPPLSSDSTVHLLPCAIEYDGTAPVKSFFRVSTEADGTHRSHFRGRELRGKLVDLPDTVEGLCVGDSGGMRWRVEGHFSAMHVWEHDTLPDLAPVKDCLAWFDLADAVHST